MIPDIVSSLFGTNIEKDKPNIDEKTFRKMLLGEK